VVITLTGTGAFFVRAIIKLMNVIMRLMIVGISLLRVVMSLMSVGISLMGAIMRLMIVAITLVGAIMKAHERRHHAHGRDHEGS
jgi:hypothetical protein